MSIQVTCCLIVTPVAVGSVVPDQDSQSNSTNHRSTRKKILWPRTLSDVIYGTYTCRQGAASTSTQSRTTEGYSNFDGRIEHICSILPCIVSTFSSKSLKRSCVLNDYFIIY